MSRVDDPEPAYVQPPEDETRGRGILSTRSLLILAISMITATISGASAGLSASMATASLGVGDRVAVGFLAAISAGAIIGLTTASTLNNLVNRP